MKIPWLALFLTLAATPAASEGLEYWGTSPTCEALLNFCKATIPDKPQVCQMAYQTALKTGGAGASLIDALARSFRRL